MKNFLLKQKMMNHPVDIIYMDKKGHTTYRTIFVKKITNDKVIAFCTLREQQRTFELNRILAAEKASMLRMETKITPGSNLMWISRRMMLPEHVEVLHKFH
ncbi:putative DNA-binding transcriptional regulator YafY [Caldalkalibacillus uzonensis]|uniref:DNA-binding transcriptional regulator YafY n=1 Tax=Caldalkalibacillus uzonensis TaxID=353224 RepID=A0ABU0CY77_9BACI|nr:hypothetical protein [Caldalkalibacillus uzonensis]MDQ0341104.1 putative DNA-binding transcriptional regulator YafY [Caldalkalibacillus uzonensis]